jgi:hypothetical protein
MSFEKTVNFFPSLAVRLVVFVLVNLYFPTNGNHRFYK